MERRAVEARTVHGRTLCCILSGFLLAGCGPGRPEADLLVTDASLFDARSGKVTEGMSVVVAGGRIQAVGTRGEVGDVQAARVIRAEGRLLTPGLMDAHAHSAYLLATSFNPGGGGIADLDMDPDSIARYRRVLADAYLPWGVTVVRDAGTNEEHLPLQLAWMSRSPRAPDFLPSGAALVSHEEGRTPYPGHRVVADSAEAVAVVRRYREAGLGYVKLYWRLREPEFRAALAEGLALGMVPFAHVDFGVMSYDGALELGLRHFEHLSTLPVQRLGPRAMNDITLEVINQVLGGDRRGAFFMAVMEAFNQIGEGDAEMMALFRRMAEAGGSLTPTLHVLARPLGLSFLPPDPIGAFDDTSAWTPSQMERARKGFRVALSYLAALHGAGVQLAVGTDTVDPGPAVLSEILLLQEAGLPMSEVLRIATLGTAQVMERSRDYGSVEAGKRAHFVLFDENPLEGPAGLLGGKTVVKDGVVYVPAPPPA